MSKKDLTIYRRFYGTWEQYDKVFKFRWWNPAWLFKMWRNRQRTNKAVNEILAKFPKPKP